MKKSYLFLMIILLTGIINNITAQTVRYVKEVPEGTGDGSSWQNASNDLQAMINASTENDIIWVAAGTYTPVRPADNLAVTDPDNRDNAFVLKKNVSIYGGFSGTETDILQRDWENNITLLSGDMGIIADTSDNAYHVVISAGDVGTACLDGFTIKDGNANGIFPNTIRVNENDIYTTFGGGIYNSNSSPALTNILISENAAESGGGISNFRSSTILNNVKIYKNAAIYGGGIANEISSPIIKNVTIRENKAFYSGGGIHNYNNCSPILINVDIIDNTADAEAGGIFNAHSSPILRNVTISGNKAPFGAGMVNNESASVLTNVSIVNNTAEYDGGGMYNIYSSAILTNVTISGNRATIYGGGIYNNPSSPVIRNSIIWGNTLSGGIASNIDNNDIELGFPVFAYSLVGDENIGNGIILNSNPLFVNDADGNFRLSGESPCIAAGNIAFYNADSVPDLSGITTDIEGKPRLVNGQIDLGAYQTLDDTKVIKFNADNIKIYPNPVKDILYIDSTVTIEQVGIYDISGKLMKQINKTQDQIHVDDLANGIYIVKIKTVKNETINIKMVKGRD